jgi:hypothetical protein
LEESQQTTNRRSWTWCKVDFRSKRATDRQLSENPDPEIIN